MPLREEKSLIVAHAYRLAYEDYFNASVGKRISRFLHISKPKRVSVIARIAYELKIVPFSVSEVFISDTCSPCTEKFEVISFNSKSLNDCSNSLQVAVKTNYEQSTFIRQLKAIDFIIDNFRRNIYRSPFLHASSALVREVMSYLQSLEASTEATPIIESQYEEANYPEKLSTAFSVFLQDCEGYVSCLEHAKNRVIDCCQQMLVGIKQRYPISQHQLRTDIDFGWKVPSISSDKLKNMLGPIEELVAGLQLEIKPDIDKIEIESKLEIGRLEQNAKLEAQEIERNFETEKDHIKGDMELSLKRLGSAESSLKRQLELLESEYKEATTSYQEAYDESISSDSLRTLENSYENIEYLRQRRDDLEVKMREAEQALRTVRSEFRDTKKHYEDRIEKLQQSRELTLENHAEKYKITISAVQEARKRRIDDKLAHVTAINQERVMLEELIKTNMSNGTETFETTESVELQNLWRNETIIDLKIGAIESLQRRILTRIGDALKSIEETKQFLRGHLIRAALTSSMTLEMLIPFWYIEIESGPIDHPLIEAHIVSPSEVVLHGAEERTRTILGITFIPRLPSVASTLDSVKGDQSVQLCAHSNNQIRKLNPAEFLSTDHWIVREQYVVKKFYKELRADFKKRIEKG